MHRRKEYLDHQLDELSRQRALCRGGREMQVSKHFLVNFFKMLFICRERRREGEREEEKRPSVASLTLQLGTRPATQACALTGS